MGITTSPLVVRIFINRGENGWAERIPILETDWYQALPQALALVQARSNILAKGAVIEWATLGTTVFPYIEQALITTRLKALPIWDFDGGDATGLYFQWADDLGHCVGRLFRAIDQSEIRANHWIRAPFILPPGIAPLPMNILTATKAELFANFFTVFRSIAACCFRDGPRVNGVQAWDLNPWASGKYTRISKRNVGGRWDRCSWEAGNWNYAPEFAVCGMAVTALRFSYQIPCVFGPGRQTQSIHYYYAKRGATVFPLPHIFWGRYRAQEIKQFDPVGETRKGRKSDWCEGFEYGNAPGVAFEGSPAFFLGQTPQSWPTGQATPIILRPACDRPVSQPAIGRGGVGFGGAGVIPTLIPGPPPPPSWAVDGPWGGADDLTWTSNFMLPTLGKTLVMSCMYYEIGTTFTFPPGWSLVATQEDPGAEACLQVWIYPNAPAIASVTMGMFPQGGSQGVCIKVSGLTTNAVDQVANALNAGLVAAPGSVTTTHSNEIALCIAAHSAGTTLPVTASAGYATLYAGNPSSFNNLLAISAAQISSPATTAPTLTFLFGSVSSAAIVTLY
jgi:hypothetical protein